MNEELPILPLLVGAMALTVFSFDINRRRSKLRAIFNTFDREESVVAETLEAMVRSGSLLPYKPPATA